MAKLFVSYRQLDSGDIVNGIVLRLKQVFGKARNVFHDVATIRPGDFFPAEIRRRLNDSDAMIVVIGPHYVDSVNASRLLNEDDPVRLEMEMAMVLGIPIVPVTVGNAQMPAKPQLPATLSILADIQAHPVRSGRGFEDDLDKLIVEVKRIVRPRRLRRLFWPSLIVMTFLVSAIASAIIVRGLFPVTKTVEVPKVVEKVVEMRVPSHSSETETITVRAEESVDTDGQKQHRLWIEADDMVLESIEEVKYLLDPQTAVDSVIESSSDPALSEDRHFLVECLQAKEDVDYPLKKIAVLVVYRNESSEPPETHVIWFRWADEVYMANAK